MLASWILLLSFLAEKLSASSADPGWPQWRGPDRTGISPEKGLLKEWPAGGPKKLWMFDKAGKGYSGPAVAGGKLFLLGTRNDKEVLFRLDIEAGKEDWTAEVGEILPNDWGDGPRGTPTIDADGIYAMGGKGILIRADAGTGKILWRKTMKELGGGTPDWGYTESVLVDGNKVLCTPGGKKGTIAALDKKTGELIWQSKDFTDSAQYASLIAAEVDGVRQYIQLTMKHLVGVAAADGAVVWQSDWPGQTAVIPTPIYKDHHVYVSSGYGVGCKLVKLGPDKKAEEVYQNKNMKNHHGGVILIQDHLYGYSDGPGWMCQDFKTGNIVWKEKSKLEKGSVSSADGMLYCLGENAGEVVLIEASTEGWEEHGRFKLDPQTKIRSSRGHIWTHPVIAGGRLFLRDQDLLFCFDVKNPG